MSDSAIYTTVPQSAILVSSTDVRDQYLQWVQKRRQALLMELAELDNQLILAGMLKQRTVDSQATRRTKRK